MANKLLALAIVLATAASVNAAAATVAVDPDASLRVLYGRNKLEQAIKQAGVDDGRIVIAEAHDPKWGKEGFAIVAAPDGAITITGGDDCGALYGSLELARRIRESKKLPTTINCNDKPA